MDEHEWLTERFEEHRTRLHAVAHRMLGSLSETDDAVQEAWLRLSRLDTASRCASSGLDGPSRRGESGGAPDHSSDPACGAPRDASIRPGANCSVVR
jgi:Sigma-70 region 2